MANRYAGIHDNAKNTVQAFLHKFGTMFKYGVASTGNTTTAWQVTQRGAGANMSVDIAAGSGLLYDASFPYAPWSDATINKTVTTAPSGGNSRKDIVVAYINESAITTASDNGLDAFDFMVVAGTAAASPSDPSDGTIQSAVGSGNPWVKLARITVPASVSSIINSYITDLREPIAFKGKLFGGSSNTVGHTVPNVADDTVVLLAATQTITGKTISQAGNTFVNPYKFRAYSASAQNGIAGSTWTTIVLGTEDYDSNSNFASNTYTAPVDGYYHFDAFVTTTNTAGLYTGMGIRLLKNGATAVAGDPTWFDNNVSFDYSFASISDTIFLTAGDTIVLQGYILLVSGTGGFTNGLHTRLSGHLISKT